jgi:Carboxypeptidase regulatory-like domain
VVVTLQPLATITGRVADADDDAVSGATIRTDPLPSGGFSLSLGQVATDQEGRFRVPNVPPGCDYQLVAETGVASKRRRVAFFKKASVRAGETTDVGKIRFEKD